MPAVSEKQKRFMQAVAHNRGFAKKVGVPQSVGREFSKAKGGEMKESKAMMRKEVSFMKKKGAPKSMLKHEMAEMKSKGRGMAKAGMQKKAMKHGGIASSLRDHAAAPASKAHAKMARGGGIESRGKTKVTMVKMARGGGIEVRGKTRG
ncbi:MAG: hypothetical protein ACO3ST_01565 [Burkholderiaceae bacterium]